MRTKGVSIDYLAAGANRQAAVADWSRNGLVAFGADVNVALWRPDLCPPTGIERLLSCHKRTVKAVKFLLEADGDESSYLLTGADDGTLIVWKSTAGGLDFAIHQTCQEYAGAVNCIAEARPAMDPPRWIIVTGAADASIRTWSFESGQLLLRHTVHTAPKYFPLALSLAILDGTPATIVVAAAGTRDSIQILTADAAADDLFLSLQTTLVGHEAWVRSLDLDRQVMETGKPGHDLLLASASQDKYVRIWRIHEGLDLPALPASAINASGEAFLPAKSPSNKAYRFKAAGSDFSVTFEALLLGHEDWIYSARWHAHLSGKLQLLSTSADNSLAIWEADPSSGIWVSTVRLGEISREQGATTATGSTGGFWTGLWSPDGQSVACLGRTGSWRVWQYDSIHDEWRARVAVSGHTKAVTGITWSKSGSYLLSTSSDQTTRLHAAGMHLGGGPWHEMSRPQIHGYDLNCIDSLGDGQFVSGADEKLMRVFRMPKAVATMLGPPAEVGETDAGLRPQAANMPVLGLSNKAVDMFDEDAETQAEEGETTGPVYAVSRSHVDIHQPPLEDTLSRHTLWPEVEKLYGHGYEISCLAASHDGTVIASACKASSSNHAVIRLFETHGWTEVKPPLTAHSLTATRLRFSADDRFLLSVGRDRQWAVFERDPNEPAAFRLLQLQPKGHSRMILDAAWAPCETPVFATAGRDKQVRIWTSGTADTGARQFTQTAVVDCAASVTAVDFLSRRVNGLFVLAVGTEAGRLSVCLVEVEVEDDGDCSGASYHLPPPAELAFPGTVLQLAWRPYPRDFSPPACRSYTLAAAGEDGSVRLFTLDEDYLRPAGRSDPAKDRPTCGEALARNVGCV